MRKKQSIYIGIGVGAALVAIAVIYLITDMQNTPKADSLALDFTYDEAFKNIGENLKSNGIVMSLDLRFKDYKNAEICRNFFAKPEMQKLVEYCASAELRDGNKSFLGNLHMVGSPDAPKLVVVLLQSDPMISQVEQIKTIFGSTIVELVCTCWKLNQVDMTLLETGLTHYVTFILVETNHTVPQKHFLLHQSISKSNLQPTRLVIFGSF